VSSGGNGGDERGGFGGVGVGEARVSAQAAPLESDVGYSIGQNGLMGAHGICSNQQGPTLYGIFFEMGIKILASAS
jgi:hypothetical protein